MKTPDSPFLKIDQSQWICSNALCFAIFDNYPVSKGHALIVTHRVVATWFECTNEEQSALMELVNQTKEILDKKLDPKPDGYNIGFNAGAAAGQTVAHVHIHVIPRYQGDMKDPRGGVRHVIPAKGNYLTAVAIEEKSKNPTNGIDVTLTTGFPSSPLWPILCDQLFGALEIDLVAAFAQRSGLDLIQEAIFRSVQAGARVRILVSDYLGITDPEALEQLSGWITCTQESDSEKRFGRFEARLLELERIPGRPASFHPKSWRISDASEDILVVGSSNISKAALLNGIEWNLIGKTSPESQLLGQAVSAFETMWGQASLLNSKLIEEYRSRSKNNETLRAIWDGDLYENTDQKRIATQAKPDEIELPSPRPWQIEALKSLEKIREQSFNKALVAVATGLGKTWLAAFDIIAVGKTLGRCPKILVIAHRAEILTQAESTIRTALRLAAEKFGWKPPTTTWFVGDGGSMSGDIVVATVQKLTRYKNGVSGNLESLGKQAFDYCVIDEVHHAQAPSYRRLIAKLQSRFTLGLTATPERTDGIDVATLFDDILAAQATISDGIEEGSLVPFRYRGLKDDVDFEQIPWRNGKFDPEILERKLENSARMERLWNEWKGSGEIGKSKTLVFCVSKRHALFTRNWLRARGISCAAVFSQGEVNGPGGVAESSDPRIESIQKFARGAIEALCVVDLFNEGVDIPLIDRVVMLRPTESKVIFLQQLGRGLRSAEGKTRLNIIDFVGNHKVFASRLTHILSLNKQNHADVKNRWSLLASFVREKDANLPPGCVLDVDIEAIELMKRFLPSGKAAAIEAYRALKIDFERRPTPSEVLQAGYLPMTVSGEHATWFHFCLGENDLTPGEQNCLEQYGAWFEMLQTTNLTKSYKMIVLRVLLDQQTFWEGLGVEDLSEKCHQYLKNHPVLRQDLEGAGYKEGSQSDEKGAFMEWWLKWPLNRWADRQGDRKWFQFDGDKFSPSFKCEIHLQDAFEFMTGELVDYRLAQYSKKRLSKDQGWDNEGAGFSFMAKVSHSNGKAILFLPTLESNPQRPLGPKEVSLPDGSTWIFKFVKVACNIAYPKSTDENSENQLSQLLKIWFGDNAGLPGTNFEVEFREENLDGNKKWTVKPINLSGTSIQKRFYSEKGNAKADTGYPFYFSETIPKDQGDSYYIPVFNLNVAAGLWGPESTPEAIGWAKLDGMKVETGMFVAQVMGHSMEPKIPDKSWCVFRKPKPGSRQNKIVLVQFNSLGDPENGGRFTVKKYQSEKRVSPEGWEHQAVRLVPMNPEYAAIEIQPDNAGELLIVGEFVQVLSGG